MAKRLRLLIYEGPTEWIQGQRQYDGIQGCRMIDKHPGRQKSITSIELSPWRITLLEVVRVLWRETHSGRRKRMQDDNQN